MSRQWIPRLAAPAAFLLGVTVAVVLVRAGLDDDEEAARQASIVTTVERSATATRARTQPRAQPVFATVEEGDTLDQIALEHDTTVERLLALNRNLDPTALQIGQRIRVR